MHENSEDSEATLSMYDILEKREKGCGCIRFQN